MRIEGSSNTAVVHTEQSEDEAESSAIDQITEMVNHEAFEGDDDVRIMPDFHWGAGAVIGFTMPVKDRICPNTIGVDIGCGMHAACFGELDITSYDDAKQLDPMIRERIPLGREVHDNTDYHLKNEFPWNACQQKLEAFDEETDFDLPFTDTVSVKAYDADYFDNLVERIEYDDRRAINSIGTLGGGNHFIELGVDSQDRVWSVIHSGSRGIGLTIAQYWQDKATNKTTMRQSIDDVPESVAEYMNEDWKPKADKIREDFDGKEIQNKFDEVSQAIQEYGPSTNNRNTDLDYLEGNEAWGYIRDMIFAQTYASVSREQMSLAVLDTLREYTDEAPGWFEDTIESVHNYIDFHDGVIRKGACRSHKGERLVIPFNIEYGTLICEGLGSDDWNNSAPHGAGRAMSRTQAENWFDDKTFHEQTNGVYTSATPLDEIPGAYKSPETIENAIGPTATVVERVEPFLNIKAE